MSNPEKTFVLIVGVNYLGKSYALNGCAKDSRRMLALFVNMLGVPRDNIIHLCDEKPHDNYPSAYNIRVSMDWLVKKSEKADNIFFHFSGHGSLSLSIQTNTNIIDFMNTIQKDDKKQYLIPSDFPENIISDDEIFKRIYQRAQCPILSVIDACHSGNIGELFYTYNLDRNSFSTTSNYFNTDKFSVDQVMISGCKLDEKCVDYYDKRLKDFGGAMTNAFLDSLVSSNYSINYRELLINMDKFLKNLNIKQRPVFACNKTINMNNNLTICVANKSIIEDSTVLEIDPRYLDNKKYTDTLLKKIFNLENQVKTLEEKINEMKKVIS